MDVNETPLAIDKAPTRREAVLAISFGVAVLLYISSCLITRSYGASFFATPFFVGITAGILSTQQPYRNSLYALGAAILLSILLLREGVVCVLFSLPIVVPQLLAGALLGHVSRRYLRSRHARLGGIGGALCLALAWQSIERITDDPRQHPVHTADAEIHIAAPPEHVFAELTAPHSALAQRWPWFLRVGLPMPHEMRVEEPGPNGKLRFHFSQGIAHARVTRWQPAAELAFRVERYEITDLPFHITRLGRGPHYGLRTERVDDWLTLQELRYTLYRTPDGGTRLRRSMAWQRHLAPTLYFGWLQQTIIERSQIRLLELLRERIEERRSLREQQSTAMLR